MKITFNILLISFLTFISSALLLAQSPFSKVYYLDTASAPVHANSIVRTTGNHYLLAGEENLNPLIIKTYTSGNIIWSKTYGLHGSFFCLTGTYDSCYVFAGNIFNSEDSASNIFCVKINYAGDTLWTREIDMGINDYALSIQQTNDKGYILCGFTSPDNYNAGSWGEYYYHYTNIIIARLDSSGNIMWGKIISGGNYSGIAMSIKQIPDSGFIATGSLADSNSEPYYTSKFFLLKTDPSGNIIWFKKHNWTVDNPSVGLDLLVTTSGLLYYFSANDYGCVLMKSDFSGNVIWGKQYNVSSGGAFNLPLTRMHPCSDQGFIITTWNGLLKTDSTGTLAWTSSYWVSSVSDCLETADKGFIVLGNGPIIVLKYNQQPEIALLKTDSLGNTSECFEGADSITSSPFYINMIQASFTKTMAGTIKMQYPQITDVSIPERNGCVDVVGGSVKENQPDNNFFKVYPDPSDGHFQIIFNRVMNLGWIKTEIYNPIGQKVYESENSGTDRLPVNLNGVSDGIYFIRVMNNGNISSQKIIIDRKD